MMTTDDTGLGDRDPGTAVRAGMSACVSDIRMPASLLDRAVSQHRRRTTRLRLAGAAGVTAVIAAAAVTLTALPGAAARPGLARPGGPGPARPAAGLPAVDAAYVLRRAAAAQVNSDRMISVDRNGTVLTYTDVTAGQQRIVQPGLQIATAIGGGADTQTDVDYRHHVYSTVTTSSLDHGTHVTVSSFLPLQTSPDPAVAFRNALRAGTITVAGHRNLYGRDTILIRVKPAGTSGSRLGVTASGVSRFAPASWIWIDASTYLVVQAKYFTAHFQASSRPSVPGPDTTWSPVIEHVTWLAPTRGNLALLTLTPPAGYAKIPYPELARKYLAPLS